MITNAPARVDDNRPTTVGPAPKRRTGLVPMRAGSQHNITIGGGTVIATARAHEDVRKAKVRYICLHDKCAGKSWANADEMIEAHPQRAEMAKRDEVHVYGMWSDDAQAEGPRKLAETERDKAAKMIAKLDKMAEDAKTIGELTAAREQKALEESRLRAAETEVARHSGVVGLIAPPDRSADE